MPPSSFAVFVDTPVEAPKLPVVSKPDNTAGIDISATVSAVLGVVALANKENLDPITGEKLNVPEAGKKRKNSLVALKSVASVESKGLKDASDSQPDAKKRKGLTRARSASASTLPLKRVSKPVSTGSKRPTKKARRAPMPMVDEESEIITKAADAVTLTQTEIDSKCKELTVLPLADVSEAYDAASFLDPLSEEPSKDDGFDDAKSPFVRDSSTEPYIRDYFPGKPDPRIRETSFASRARSLEPTAFSTPERKEIWASFNFESPSPIKKRAGLKRSFSTAN